jgi:hypothetical protein
VGLLEYSATYQGSDAPYAETSQEIVLSPLSDIQDALGPEFRGLSESELVEALLESSGVDPEELAEFFPALAAALPAIGSALLPAVTSALPAIGSAVAGLAGNVIPKIATGAIQGLAGGGGAQGGLAGAAMSVAQQIPALVGGLLRPQPQPALPAPPAPAQPPPVPQPPSTLGGIPWPFAQIRPLEPVPRVLSDIMLSITRLESMLQQMQQTLAQRRTPAPQASQRRRRARSAARPAAAPGAAPAAASAAEDLGTLFSNPAVWASLRSALAGPGVGSRQVAVNTGAPVPTMVDVGAVLNTVGQVVQQAATEHTRAAGGEEIPEYLVDPATGELREGVDDLSERGRAAALVELFDEANRYQLYQYRRRARANRISRGGRRQGAERRRSRIIDDGSPGDRDFVDVGGRLLNG